ncbi:diguanylate cyclase [Solidesulfovibrio alcoholivorans]|uniref:diguanylate cyclase n=1 Tax=Solidesulfovibrio alcoholivorans TaxID=81406 RepID=UPI00049646A3|nr:diguanylate cyclase [Solidesulfovibrio alcoholivorans]
MPRNSASLQKYRPLSRLHILVVEDDFLAREQMGLMLSRFAGRLTTAVDGAEGLERFKYERPDIVVTDISMPRMDGLDLAEAVKAMDKATPVVLVTAHSDTAFFLRSIAIGVDGYVVKPVEAESLLGLLARLGKGLLETRAAASRAQLFQFTLDINPNFILTCDAGEVDYVNRTFLEFLGAPSLAALKAGEHAGRTLEIDGRRHEAGDLAWTEHVGGRPGATHQAVFSRLPGEKGQPRTFLVSAAEFPELERRVLTFTDITPLAEERRALLMRAATDALTGIANRAGLDEFLDNAQHRANAEQTPLSVIMFDIDHFKVINDTYGHQAGDAVLVELSRLVGSHVRVGDLLGRYGGEEFLIVAPGAEHDVALQLAERLRAVVEKHLFPVAGGLTCSFGLAVARVGESAPSLVGRADEALYRAKEAGRNRVAAD